MKIRSEGISGVLAPALARIWTDWALYWAVGLALLCAYIESYGLLSDRAKIVRDVIPLGTAIDIGALASVLAAGTIFASLMTKRFVALVGDADYLISIFFFSVFLLVASAVSGFILYLLSYSDGFVDTQWFFIVCVFAEWLFLWAFLQVIDSFRIVALQLVFITREATVNDASERAPSAPGV